MKHRDLIDKEFIGRHMSDEIWWRWRWRWMSLWRHWWWWWWCQ